MKKDNKIYSLLDDKLILDLASVIEEYIIYEFDSALDYRAQNALEKVIRDELIKWKVKDGTLMKMYATGLKCKRCNETWEKHYLDDTVTSETPGYKEALEIMTENNSEFVPLASIWMIGD